ncbi:MAG: Ferredoxin [Chloroflexi bacterium]|nr:Ferredoxin [Chloroflexota bacterium]
MTYVITALCLHDGECLEECPTECIVPGSPVDEYPYYYIDAEECIDCGACAVVCPQEAIFMDDEVPDAYEAYGDEYLSMPKGTPGFDEEYEVEDIYGDTFTLYVRKLEEGETVDLTAAIEFNDDFFVDGPGYDALD